MKDLQMYGLFDGEYLVFKGTRYQICDYANIGEKSFYAYLNGQRKLNSKWWVRHVSKNEVVVAPKPPKSKNEQRFEYLYSMLKLYGNTCSSFDPEPYINQLRDKGLDVEMRKSVFKGYYLEVVA